MAAGDTTVGFTPELTACADVRACLAAGKDSAGLNATIDRFVAEATSPDVAIEFHNIRGALIAFMKANLEQ